MEARGQLVGVSFLVLPFGSQGLSSLSHLPAPILGSICGAGDQDSICGFGHA